MAERTNDVSRRCNLNYPNVVVDSTVSTFASKKTVQALFPSFHPKDQAILHAAVPGLFQLYQPDRIPDFNFDDWENKAINTTRQINEDGVEETIIKWKSPKNYKQTDWFLFQEAIKKYQKQTLEIYQNSVYKQLSPGLLAEIMRFG